MSIDAYEWAIAQRADLKTGELFLLAELGKHTPPGHAGTYVSPERLADRTKMCVRTIHNHLRTLQDHGLIRWRKNYRRRRNFFELKTDQTATALEAVEKMAAGSDVRPGLDTPATPTTTASKPALSIVANAATASASDGLSDGPVATQAGEPILDQSGKNFTNHPPPSRENFYQKAGSTPNYINNKRENGLNETDDAATAAAPPTPPPTDQPLPGVDQPLLAQPAPASTGVGLLAGSAPISESLSLGADPTAPALPEQPAQTVADLDPADRVLPADTAEQRAELLDAVAQELRAPLARFCGSTDFLRAWLLSALPSMYRSAPHRTVGEWAEVLVPIFTNDRRHGGTSILGRTAPGYRPGSNWHSAPIALCGQHALDAFSQITGREARLRTPAGKLTREGQEVLRRVQEGYTLADFKAVARDRLRRWGNEDKMQEYLRPGTCFGSKFGDYLTAAHGAVRTATPAPTAPRGAYNPHAAPA